jgi:hypothetical protein
MQQRLRKSNSPRHMLRQLLDRRDIRNHLGRACRLLDQLHRYSSLVKRCSRSCDGMQQDRDKRNLPDTITTCLLGESIVQERDFGQRLHHCSHGQEDSCAYDCHPLASSTQNLRPCELNQSNIHLQDRKHKWLSLQLGISLHCIARKPRLLKSNPCSQGKSWQKLNPGGKALYRSTRLYCPQRACSIERMYSRKDKFNKYSLLPGNHPDK